MITSIKFDKKIFEDFSMAGNKDLNNLSKINVFIGKNNSGKSRFLRLLLNNKVTVERDVFNSATLNKLIDSYRSYVQTLLEKNPHHPALYHLYQALNEIPRLYYISTLPETTQIKGSINSISNSLKGFFGPEPISTLESQINNYIDVFEESSLAFDKIYIPILRGLRPIQTKRGDEKEKFVLSENNYLERTKSDYGIETGKKIHIHTGLDLYQRVKEYMLGDDEERERLQNFQIYLSNTFFHGDTVQLIPREGKDVLYLKIGKEKQYPIYSLGEGIQSIILLTYPLFFNEGKEMLFFIEEPELHLHPGLERVLIETLRDERFATFQYFITTHSNHILDLTLEYDDISVYSFQKNTGDDGNTFQIQNVSSNQKQVLEQLGVRNSSVFLANCTIWVEGITDRLYLKKYLEVLQKDKKRIFKEDYHYAFIEYGGSNITHWSFLEIDDEVITTINTEGICSKIFLIVDNDGVGLTGTKKSKKSERHEELRKKLGSTFYATKGREMENLLSKKVVRKVIEEMEGNNYLQLDFSKFESNKSFSTAYLGTFIEGSVGELKRSYKKKSGTGTILNKIDFCKKAISNIESVDDLSEEAKELGNLILNFVESNNSKTY